MLLYAIAFLAGVVTAISPCVYPVLPIIFAGGASGGRRRPYAIIAGLVVTFILSLLFVGWVLDQLGLPQDFLRKLSIAFLLLFAATLVIPQLARVIERPFLRLTRRPAGDLGGGFLLGASLGLLFVPCGGPVLGFITTQTASLAGGKRVGLAVAYALGAALPMLLLALGGQRAAGRIRSLNLQRPAVRAALGGVLAVSALLIAFNVDKTLQTKVGDYTPFLQKAERSCFTRKQLGQRCLASQHASSSALKDFGPAPPFTGISTWVNSKPLTIASLRGRVVLVDFWTYSCINCLRTLPHLKAWDAAYRKAGLTIVGVHTPEFAFEHVPSNVRKATRELGVRYPVAIDDGYKTWDAYQNGAWPTEYLIDRKGHIREIKEGEGTYDETERRIRRLLGEPAQAQLASVKDTTPQHPTTPESYLGWERLQRYSGSELVPDRIVPYKFPRSVPLNTLAYDGLWRVERQRIIAIDRARLRLHFLAQNVHLVLGGRGKLQVLVDGKPARTIRVGGLSRLYTLLSYPTLREGELELRFSPGVTAYAFTFG
ncbi:MAG TPA: cytochrome c biogenesis protein CcdA [Gaiellaceae bacterium]|nr:cytochrome c biogenesis protein CcdA [Gaiellaceae bacterium]